MIEKLAQTHNGSSHQLGPGFILASHSLSPASLSTSDNLTQGCTFFSLFWIFFWVFIFTLMDFMTSFVGKVWPHPRPGLANERPPLPINYTAVFLYISLLNIYIRAYLIGEHHLPGIMFIWLVK